MRKQMIVIGLGQFGMALARELTERDVEVLAIDAHKELIQVASAFVAEALCFDVTDEAALAGTAPARRDACVVAIGGESREASIICTALLRQMGVKRLIARTVDPLHERILKLVGAHEVVNPERDFGRRFANRLVYESVMGELPLGEDLVITEMKLPAPFVGRTLADLALPRRHAVTVVAIRRAGEPGVALPRPDDVFRAEDVAVVVARPGAVRRMMENP
jgi:trk system potassium uptake protein TrkA